METKRSNELPITMEEDDAWITAEAVLEWARNALAIIGAAAILIITLGYLGYKSVAVPPAAVSDKCINSACDTACKAGARFKRHAGCTE